MSGAAELHAGTAERLSCAGRLTDAFSPAELAGDEDVRCCGERLAFDPSLVGCTVGGLWLRGWDVCLTCGRAWLSRHSKPCPATMWTLAKGGRSVDIGNGRIRVETVTRIDVPALMARIARLPELEREVAELRARLATEEPQR